MSSPAKKIRYFVVRTLIGREAVGIVKVQIDLSLFSAGLISTNVDDTYIEDITEAEYETFRELGLFPGYSYHQGIAFGEIVVYDPGIYRMKGHRVVKRGKRDEREKRKREKRGY